MEFKTFPPRSILFHDASRDDKIVKKKKEIIRPSSEEWSVWRGGGDTEK